MWFASFVVIDSWLLCAAVVGYVMNVSGVRGLFLLSMDGLVITVLLVVWSICGVGVGLVHAHWLLWCHGWGTVGEGAVNVTAIGCNVFIRSWWSWNRGMFSCLAHIYGFELGVVCLLFSGCGIGVAERSSLCVDGLVVWECVVGSWWAESLGMGVCAM